MKVVKMWMKQALCALLACALLAACAGAQPALAEDDEDLEISIMDLTEEANPDETDLLWDFPVALSDMEPDFVRLANKHMLLGKDYIPQPLVTMKQRKADKNGVNTNGGVNKATGSAMQLQETCAEALVAMSEAAREDGYVLYLKSAYRSWKTQNTMYYNRLKKNNGKDDGWVSKPGASDHQTGLGCDVVPRSWRDKAMNEKMASAPECQWMAEHCHEFGFILRYPSDKEDITEINYEPWHMRYVGIPAATYIMENGLCLEEFHEQLAAAIQQYLDWGGDPSVVEPFIQVSAEE